MRLVGKGGSNQYDEDGFMFKYQFFCRVFAFLGLVCLFTTMVSPYWIEIDGSYSTSYAGLWNICRTRKCQGFTVTSKILVIIRALILFSTISGLVAVTCTFLMHSSFKRSKFPFITNSFTGLISLLTMLLYSWSIKPNSTLGSPIPPTPYPISLFWAFYMGCFACVLFLLNGLLHLLLELQKLIDLIEEHKNNMKLKELGPTLLEEMHKESILSKYKANIFA